MRVILDTNILMSALIKDSFTRKIIFESEFDFHYPKESFRELQKHELLILEKSGMTKQEYEQILLFLLKHIKIVSQDFIRPYFDKAIKIMAHIDPDDVIFIATALAYDSIIWSDDAHFQKQDEIKIITTREMVELQKEN